MATTSGKRQLEVILNYNDRLSGKAPKTIKALSSIESQAKRTTAAVNLLNKSLGRVGGKSSKGAGRLPADLQLGTRITRQLTSELARGLKLETQQTRLLREQTRARTEGVRLAREEARLSEQITRQHDRAQRPAPRRAPYRPGDWMLDSDRPPDWRRELDEQPRPRRRGERADWARRVENFGRRAGDVRDSFSSFGSAARTAGEFARPALEQLRAETEFRIMNLPEADRASGMQSVERTLEEVKGVRRADVIKDLTALVGVTGSVGEATPLLSLFAQYRAGMEARYGDRVSPEAITENISNTMRAIELLGKDRPTGQDAQGNFYTTPQDIERIKLYSNMIMRASAASGGDVDPTKFRQFAQYSRTAGMSLSEEGTLKALPLVQQMGGSQAGTALASLQQALIGGQMPSYKLAEWQRMGWVQDPSKIVKTKGGVRVLPGGIRHTDLLQSDPTAFVAELEKELRTRQGVDTQDPKAVNARLYGLFGNRIPMGMVAQAINAQAALEKETGNYRRALDIPGVYADVFREGNPLGGLLDYRAKETDAQARAAMKAIGAGGGLPGAAADWMGAHPDAAAVLSGLGALAKASTETAEGVGLLGSAVKGLAGGGGGATGGGSGILGTGIDVGDAAVGGGWALGRFGGYVRHLAPALVSRLALPLAIGTFAYQSMSAIHDQYLYDTEKRKKAEGDAGLGFDEIKRRREAAGGRLPDDVARGVAARAFPGLDRRGLLNELDIKTYGGPGYPGVMAQPQYNRLEMMAGGFARRAPELQYPEVMRSFIADIQALVGRGELKQAPADAILDVARKAFPESFAQASAEAGAALGKLPEPATQTGKALSEVVGPARQLPPALNFLGGELYALGGRINSLDIRPPSITLPPTEGLTGTGKPPASGPRRNFGIDLLNPLPKSSVGSVIQSDGVVNLHRGNVVMPARLSRRSPGDWLESAQAIQAAMGGGMRDDQRDQHSPAARAPRTFALPIDLFAPARLASNGRRERRPPTDELSLTLGLADGSTARGIPDERQRAATVPDESAGTVDYSLFQAGRGGGGHTFNVTLNVPAGSAATQDPAELTRLLRAELARLAAQLEETRADLYDPRFHGNMTARELNWQRERA